MIDRIRIKGFRSIVDSQEINMRPITVVVGKNSSGKSSFVRLLPLIKQTIEEDSSDPLLWYGELVDFADFNNSTFQKQGNPITISFETLISFRDHLFSHPVDSKSRKRFVLKEVPVRISLRILKHRFSCIRFDFFDQVIEIKISKGNTAKVYINNSNKLTKNIVLRVKHRKHALIPSITVISSNEKTVHVENDKIDPSIELQLSDYLRYYYSREYGLTISDSINGISLFRQIPLYSKEEIEKKFTNNYCESAIKSIRETIGSQELNNLMVLFGVDDIIYSINNELRSEFTSLNYIKPIRAKVERYYRTQGISIDEVNSDGSNIPMILHNMPEQKRQNFYNWTRDRFGIEFKAIPTGGHVSLVIYDQVTDTKNINLADTGYGYSQILPIVLLLWMTIQNDSIRMHKQIIIEQPELHLHPAMQAKLARVMALVVTESLKKNAGISIVFETHSEAMVNELGKLVASGKLSKEIVSVLAFDKEDKATSIRECKFDENGLLMNWPIGFFSTRD